jgi:hypothetical protein
VRGDVACEDLQGAGRQPDGPVRVRATAAPGDHVEPEPQTIEWRAAAAGATGQVGEVRGDRGQAEPPASTAAIATTAALLPTAAQRVSCPTRRSPRSRALSRFVRM